MLKMPVIFQQSKLLSGIQCQAQYIFFDNEHKRPTVLKSMEPQDLKGCLISLVALELFHSC